jgi:xylose dehydrogenase (NAD/NADP)
MIRLGILSTANINRETLAAARTTERVQVVAVASREPGRARAYADVHGIPGAHGSYEELLADPGVDAVYVSLPNGLHHPWTLRALAAGKHVLCEKPYTRRAVEVEEAYAAADAGGLILMEAFMYRHHPQTAHVQELVGSGAIGRLCAVKTTFTFPLGDLTNVRADAALDGGALMDVGCYCVSAIRLLAGEPERVSGELVLGETGVDMAFHGTLVCRDGVIGQFEASFRSQRRQCVEVVGSDGTILVEAPFRTDWEGSLWVTRGDGADGERRKIENLADAIEGRAPQRIGREDALGQARTIEALYAAAAGRTVVEL